MPDANIIEDDRSTAIPQIGYQAKYELNAQTAFNRSLIENAKRCGCFHCGSSFDASEIHGWLKEPSGEDTALCPYCGVDAVIVGTGDYPLTTALLSLLYMEWFDKEYREASSIGNSIPDYRGFNDYLRKGIPFRIEHDSTIEVVGSIELFHIGLYDMSWYDLDLESTEKEPIDHSIEIDETQSEAQEFEEDDEGTGAIVSVAAYFDENGYYCFDMIDSAGNKLPYEPWTGTMQDLVLNLTKQYGNRLKGLFKSPYSDTLDLFVEKN